MKRITAVVLGVLVLAGCDEKFQASNVTQSKDTLSIAAMIATGKEEMTSECKKGEISFECEFLTGDLIGTGKWHHTKLYLNNNGKVDMIVDGNAYYQSDTDSNTYAGRETTIFYMAGLKGGRGEVSVVRTNDGKSLNFEAYNSEDKRFVMGGINLN